MISVWNLRYIGYTRYASVCSPITPDPARMQLTSRIPVSTNSPTNVFKAIHDSKPALELPASVWYSEPRFDYIMFVLSLIANFLLRRLWPMPIFGMRESPRRETPELSATRLLLYTRERSDEELVLSVW
jgi:hypothetical protein